MPKHRILLSLLSSLLILTGCATQPIEWKGTIEEQPPLSIDDTQVSGNDAIWLWHTNKWFYRGGKEVIAAPETWDYDPQALVFRFQTPPQLNLYRGKPHNLYLKVFQLSDLKVFKDIASTPAGIRELLSSPKESIDSSILSANELNISPSNYEVLVLDRFKETRFVAIVAGYFQMNTENSVRIFEIPSVANRYEEMRFSFDDLNPFAEPPVSDSARIKAWVDLGVTKVSRMQMLAQ
jgi:predicted component of type VI protein secretion system